MGLRQRLMEALYGLGKASTPQVSNKVIVNLVEQSWGATPSVSLQTQMDTLYKDALLWFVGNHLTSEIMAGGIEVDVDKNYTIKIDGRTALEYLNKWNERVNLDEIMAIATLELVSFGNSFWRLRPNGVLSPIPLTGIMKLVAKNKTTPIYEEYNIQLSHTLNDKKILYEEIIHFRAHATTDSLPWGKGLVEALLQAPDSDTPSMIVLRNKFKQAQTNLALRAGRPMEYVSVEGANDDELEAAANEIKEAPYEGARVVTAKKFSVITTMLPRSGLMDTWGDFITRETLMILGDPILGLTSQPGYTFASAEVANRMHSKTVSFYQRIMKRAVERVWYQVLEKSGYDPDKVNARLRFKLPAEVEDLRKDIKYPSEEKREKTTKIPEDEEK